MRVEQECKWVWISVTGTSNSYLREEKLKLLDEEKHKKQVYNKFRI